MTNESKGLETAAKVIAIIAFALVMTALAIAIIGDIAIFAQQILAFVGACIMAVLVFIIAFILMVISCVLIFGIYILGEYGFWPFDWSVNIFKEIMADNQITPEQISGFIGLRITLLVICIIGLILAIITLSLYGAAHKDDDINKPTEKSSKLPVAFGTLSLVFSILGIFASVVSFLIAGALQ